MKRLLTIAIFGLMSSLSAFAQVSVSPDNITAYSQGATSAYLTFSNVVNLTPAEATWCGEVVSAGPDIGLKCNPATIFGSLPTRYNQSRQINTNYTDIMSITPAVARRAYLAAVGGADSRFYYVKHFVSTNGGPDQFVAVTIRLSGNGAGVPFSVTAVKLLWQEGTKVVPFIKPNDKLPAITAEIRYTGTGRLKGRWEIVKPGEQLPDRRDLLSEASLPPEERGSQRRYTLLSRFNVDLPPGGKHILPGPENWRIDKSIEGMYILLFRVEASDAPNSVSDAGANTVSSGGVAGFAMPVLRYYVGNSSNVDLTQITNTAVSSDPDADLLPIFLRWKAVDETKLYRIEIQDEVGKKVFSAIVLSKTSEYLLPSFIKALSAAKALKWRVFAVNSEGRTIDTSDFHEVRADQN